MPIATIQLLAKHEVAKNTVVFTFSKPVNFAFKPGQYGGFTLINPAETDAGGNTRRFSLLSTPDDKHLTIITRIQNSAFKRTLLGLPLGSQVKFAGPTGTFTLHDDVTIPAIFIAGGIGISPFYSMICHAARHKTSQPIYLFYGNQSLQETAFLAELTQLSASYSSLHFIPTMANPDSTWQGETGFITHTMIRKHLVDLSLPHYYICGSPVMVTTLQETLMEMGINEQQISVEDFPGY